MSKHTPGPWALDAEAKHPWIVTCPVEGFPELPGKVCEVGYLPNARLIAAAPEMLEALKAMLPENNTDEAQCRPDFETCEKARAAIAKAEGRS